MNIQILQKYQQRLTNLSSRNRSLRLLKTAKNKDIDFFLFAYEETNGHIDLLKLLINYEKIPLINKLNPHDEKTSFLDKQLNMLLRTVEGIESETGVYALKIGYPFVQGKFLNEAIARCPLIFFPYRLVKNNQNQNRWYLEPQKNDLPHWNSVFFLALEQFHEIKLPESFWEIEFPEFHDLQNFWNWLYEQLKYYDIPIKWNTEVYQQPYKMFSHYQSQYVKEFPLGELKIIPESVLGLFPETDTALFEDYEILIKNFSSLENHSAFSEIYHKEELTEGILQVVDLDASQEKVILDAKMGNNLVVQGPPGSGKSQLIINFIAENIAKGKKILLVSQKRAALDVVSLRLEKIGLQQLVNLVHDYQSDKSFIYQRWNSILQPLVENNSTLTTNFDFKPFHDVSEQYQQHIRTFQKLYFNLWDKKPYGISASELYLETIVPKNPWDFHFLPSHYTYQDLQKFLITLKEIAVYKNLFNKEHPWFYRKNLSNFTYFELIKNLQSLEQTIQLLNEQLQSVAYKGYYLMEITNLDEIIDNYLTFNEWLFNDSKFYKLYQFLVTNHQSISKVKNLTKIYDEQKNKIENFWWLKCIEKEGLKNLLQNIDTYNRLKSQFFRFFNPDWWFVNKYLNKFFDNQNLIFNEESLKTLMNEIEIFQEYEIFLKKYPWIELEHSQIDFAIEFYNRMIFDTLKPQFTLELDREHWENSVKYFTNLSQVKTYWQETQKSLETWLSNHQIQNLFSELYANKLPLNYIQTLKESFEKDGHDLLQLDKILEKISFVEKTILDKAISYIADYQEVTSWIEMIKNQIYWNWIQKLEKLTPEFTEITSKSFDWKSQQWKEVYLSYQKVSSEYVLNQWQQNLLHSIQKKSKVFKEIIYQTKKKRSVWSLRKMVETYWNNGLCDLAPCWLVSPEAASAIFNLQKELFDWVIFDEASQCYVEKAIPVMYRAKKSIIIGDSQQLQPYNLYEVKVDNLESENLEMEEEIFTEVESLLSFAEHKFKNNKLLWHYRAEHEALIQFSNLHFYEKELRFAPFPHNQNHITPPLEWVKVNGVWYKNTNEKEALKVIEILQNLINQQIWDSVGIITFNYHQQQLILDFIDQKLQSLAKDPEQSALWNRLIHHNGIEKLFVKNIENVQGDERDVIIFSVGYAPNQDGKFIQQFGSLSQKSGENRLNVAVSRAKKKIYLVTSIEPEDIKPDLSSKGAILLREYLKYVKNYYLHNSHQIQSGETPCHLAQKIALELNNYPNIRWYFPKDGMDLAIIDTQNQKNIAVFCEDGIIKKTDNIKEIEIYLPKLLTDRGWIVKKVYAKQWLLDSKKVLENLFL